MGLKSVVLALALSVSGAKYLRAPEQTVMTLDFVGAAATHYGDPASGCQSDEQSVQVTGVDGDFCSPPCTGALKRTCPSDIPDGVTAAPQCALSDSSSGAKYCALICTPGANDDQCGTNASCKSVSGVGICTYDD